MFQKMMFRQLTHITSRKNKYIRLFASSGGETVETAAHEVVKWQKYTAGMLSLCALGFLYNFQAGTFTHHPHQTRTDMDYLHIRNKPFPWPECPDCDLFDMDCWKRCREENRKKKAEKELKK